METAEPRAAGMDARRLDAVRARFVAQVEAGRFPGGQLVVRRRGVLALEVAAGVARGFRPGEGEAPVPVTPATRFAVFSASKAVVALAMAMLEERGLLDVESPVARYVPGFERHGKGELTVLDVLTHRAGVLTPALLARPWDWGHPERVREALREARPRWPRGTLAYMPYEWGWILAEVVKGATGRALQDFLKEEVARPAGLPGLRFGATPEELPGLARTYWLGTEPVRVGETELSATFEHDNNLPEVLTAFVPAAGLVCTAGDLAAFHAVLARGGVCASGRRLVSEATLRRATSAPLALDRSNRLPLRMGRGFLLGNPVPSIYGWWGTSRVFGHPGAFSTVAFAEPERELAVAIVTNGNRGPAESLWRFAPLGSAVRAACVG